MKNSIKYAIPCSVLLGLAGPAFAQTANEAADEPKEIIVIAQKKAENIQDVGIAVTALGQEALDGLGNRDVISLVNQVPGLGVQQYSTTSTIFNIRGVSLSDLSDGQEAPIAFYVDEVYLAAGGSLSGQNFDLERVEVLRGPQGTLFGRNATGGLVHFITARPTKDLSAGIELGFGRYNEFTANGFVSGPLSDRARARLAVSTRHRDDYIKNVFPGVSGGGNAKYYAARGQVEFDVGDDGLLNLKVEYLRNDKEHSAFTHRAAKYDSNGLGVPMSPTEDFFLGKPDPLAGYFAPITTPCPGCDQFRYGGTGNIYVTASDKQGVVDRKFVSTTMRYTDDFGSVSVASVTNFQRLKKVYNADLDAAPFDVFNGDSDQNLYQVSQELRLFGGSDRFNWLVGGYGLIINSHHRNRLGTLNEDPFQGALFGRIDARQKTTSFAAFAQVDYELNDVFKVIGGLRYTDDKKTLDASNFFQAPFDPVPVTNVFNQTTQPQLARINYDDYSGKIQFEARLGDGQLLYAGVNRGTKSGGFNAPVFPGPGNIYDPSLYPFGKEVLTSYEAGFKLSLADRKLYLNGSGFYYDYNGYQAYINPTNGLNLNENHDAKIIGFELEAIARPTRNLDINLSATFTPKATVYDIQTPGQPFQDPGPPAAILDTRIIQSPRWSGAASVSYEIPIGENSLRLWTNWKYTGAHFLDTYNALVSRNGQRVVGDARISFVFGNAEASVFVNNITKRRYLLNVTDSSGTQGQAGSVYNQPRTWGVNLGYRF